MIDVKCRFPWWIPAGAVLVALGYLPTLASPFDFIDDGNLVYPAPAEIDARGHAVLWWANVVANVEHLGPFRPTLWAHWHVQANVFGADPFTWRVYRLLWCGLAAAMLLWLLRELCVPATPALFATAAAMWNPYRSEIWTSLTLSEGVAMPYALLALVAARKATAASRPWLWDAIGIACVLVALGCKNTFAAIVPTQIALRVWPDSMTIREAIRRNGFRAAALAVTLALPVAHYVYFKMNWHPGQYRPPGPSLTQAGRVLSALKGGMGLDFLGAGIVLATVAVARGAAVLREYRAAAMCGAMLAGAGAVVYLPMDAMSGRYTMPAVWGLDVLFALLLTALLRLPAGRARTTAGLALCVGLVAVLVVNVHRQEKMAARARMLWNVVHHLETHAPPGIAIAWVSGDSARGALNVEEGVHVRWHLANRGRPDIGILLLDANEQPLSRVELTQPAGPPVYRVAGLGIPENGWKPDQTFAAMYQFGRKRYDCEISRRVSPSPR